MLFETVHLECHHQRFFTLKMHKNKGLTSIGREKGVEGKGRGTGGKEKGGRGGKRKGGSLDPHSVGNRLTPLVYDVFFMFYQCS